MQWKMSSRRIRQVARGSASDALAFLKTISLFLLKTIHLKTLKEILLCYYIVLLQYISYAVIRLLSSSQKSNRFLAIV